MGSEGGDHASVCLKKENHVIERKRVAIVWSMSSSVGPCSGIIVSLRSHVMSLAFDTVIN